MRITYRHKGSRGLLLMLESACALVKFDIMLDESDVPRVLNFYYAPERLAMDDVTMSFAIKILKWAKVNWTTLLAIIELCYKDTCSTYNGFVWEFNNLSDYFEAGHLWQNV